MSFRISRKISHKINVSDRLWGTRGRTHTWGLYIFFTNPFGPCGVIDTNPMVLYIKNFVDSYTLWIFNHVPKILNPSTAYELWRIFGYINQSEDPIRSNKFEFLLFKFYAWDWKISSSNSGSFNEISSYQKKLEWKVSS